MGGGRAAPHRKTGGSRMTVCPHCGHDDGPDDQRLAFNPETRTVTRGAASVRLPPRQWDILMVLWRHRRSVLVSADRIADDVWRNVREPPEDAAKCVHVHIWRMRLVLGAVGLTIYSRYGVGNGYSVIDTGARDVAA